MMFSLCDVTKPNLDVAGVTSRGEDYATLASAADSSVKTTNTAISNVAAHNEGDAVEQFKSTTGDLAKHFTQLAEAAQRTADAYKTAATAGGSAQNAMKILAKEAFRTYCKLILSGKLHECSLLINDTRTKLLKLEHDAVAKIDKAFGHLNLPNEKETNRDDIYGRVDSKIAEKWRRLSDEERREILQKIADDFADKNGYPRIELTFEPIESDPGTITWGDYSHIFPQTLRLNSDALNDPIMINTAAHEMEHRGQYEGMGFRWPWQDERAGMSRVEAERWRELDQDHVRERGGPDNSYRPRPIEVGARRAGREFVDTMSYEDFQRYLR